MDADSAQPVEQQRAVDRVVRQVAVGLGGRFRGERRHRGELRQHRRADGEVAGQAVHRALQFGRYQQPAQPPAGHRVVLGKAVDDADAVAVLAPRQRRGGPAGRHSGAVHQALINLVHDDEAAFFDVRAD